MRPVGRQGKKSSRALYQLLWALMNQYCEAALHSLIKPLDRKATTVRMNALDWLFSQCKVIKRQLTTHAASVPVPISR